ncbi:MAG: ferritin-like domain-containing protein [Candidatus Acidiferrum sp.]
MENEKIVADGMQSSVDRRAFVKRAGLVTAGIAGAAVVGGKLGMLDQIPGTKKAGLAAASVNAAAITDVDILNFALNLEYLEAEFYTVATTGKNISQIGIATSGSGNPGNTYGGKRVFFGGDEWWEDSTVKRIAEGIAFDEQQHVKFLRAALGSYVIAKPAINLDALGIGFEDFRQFLVLARAFEDTGVSAYGGAAPLITSKDYLAAAARIALTEALHSGNIRKLIQGHFIKTSKLDSQDILPPPSGTQFFEVDSNALAIVRTTSEVLAIVFGSSKTGTNAGAFFPNGVNGTINTV